MATNLKDLKITSADLVKQGANPDAHIRLFKRKDTPSNVEPSDSFVGKIAAAIAGVIKKTAAANVAKEAETFSEELQERKLREVCNQVWDYAYALDNSICSILYDGELTEEQKRDTMFTSLDEFAETLRNSIPNWASGKKYDIDSTTVAKTAIQKAAFDELIRKYAKAVENGADTDPDNDGNANQRTTLNDDKIEKNKKTIQTKEETDTMKIDKSKMTAEEQAMLAEFEKKYGTEEKALAEGAGMIKSFSPETEPELHPEVKKALADFDTVSKAQTAKIEELTKSLEIANLITVAKKYEIIGKKTDELAAKLYDLKKAGSTHYDDTIALLDEQVALVEKSGIFSEFGKNTSGTGDVDDQLGIAADEIQKSADGGNMTDTDAIIKAFENNPDLAAEYEKTYRGGNQA